MLMLQSPLPSSTRHECRQICRGRLAPCRPRNTVQVPRSSSSRHTTAYASLTGTHNAEDESYTAGHRAYKDFAFFPSDEGFIGIVMVCSEIPTVDRVRSPGSLSDQQHVPSHKFSISQSMEQDG